MTESTTPETASTAAPESPYGDPRTTIALPRVEGIALSPDGDRVVLTVATLNAKGTAYERALWAVPAAGGGAPVRLTRSTAGEAGAAFTGDGDLLFVSKRPDAEATDADEVPQLWLLPKAGGEARAITRLAGGVGGVAATAAQTGVVALAASMLPGAVTLEDDATLRAERKKTGVTAILHDAYPVRYWDHDLGPDQPHLFALDVAHLAEQLPGAAAAAVDEAQDADATTPYPAQLPRPVDLTPNPRREADTGGQALTPDGGTLIASLQVQERRQGRHVLVSIDTETGARTTLFDEPGVDFESPVVSVDGGLLAFVRQVRATPDGPTDVELWVSGVDGHSARRVAAEWDHWVSGVAFDVDDSALIVTADHDGRGPVFRIPLDDGPVERLTTDDFAYTDLRVDRASGDVVALRSNWLLPPHPVRISRATGEVTALATPAPVTPPIARMEEVETTAADGARVRGWLLLPPGATPETPAPLLLWIHGGPLNSWNAWSWRWNPQLLTARGYAVLLPDPALSTGYGLDFIARGWNAWGAAPYTDLMAITDVVEQRPEIDETRTAAMGGSFGGYMANWVAGHTDRFRAIVSHASLWALDQFAGTTDAAEYWTSIFTPEAMVEHSPHRFVADIRTPMLVVHGDKDYRVPIGEGLRLWAELHEHHADEHGELAHRFLVFPDENHWILKPQQSVVWYDTVFGFLDQHVLDAPAPA